MTLVSCLTVTLPAPARLPMLRRAISDYLRQSHPLRELVVVVDRGAPADRRAVADLVTGFGRADIRLHLPDGAMTLGALRNFSVAQARGDVLCQWDDDDLHHPDRIAMQLQALTRADAGATILQDVLLLRAAERTVRWTNWARTPSGGHPATLLCRRDAGVRYPEHGAEATLGEDLAAVLPLARTGRLHRQADAPHLYAYVTHGANTCEPTHHDRLADTLAISRRLLLRREMQIRAGAAALDLGRAAVVGPGGHAFTL